MTNKLEKTNGKIIVIDDEPNILLSIASCLELENIYVDTFTSSKDAFIAMQKQDYDCALIDIRLNQESGIELFKQLQSAGIDIPTIFMSGNASLNEAAESQKLGAYDFLEKPFSSEKLKIALENCLNFYRLKNKLKRIESSHPQNKLIGEHELMRQLRSEISKVAKTDAAVLIRGESGTGKELIARAIHEASRRSEKEFVTVNCSAIPQNLIESALFGHTKGAFTGANESKKGYFEMANQGTIFLDEIGDMPLSAQAALLRVLETKEVQKVGSENTSYVDVRVIAATHKNLDEAVEKGDFRQDLFYRINVIPITSPALRKRKSDLPLLVNYLIETLCRKHGISIKQTDNSCIKLFENYTWPGNVRELTNTLERMIIMGGEILTSQDIPKDITSPHQQKDREVSLKSYREFAERELIVDRLNQFSGNISQVARSLKIDRTHLHKKIKQYEIQRDKTFG
ncbi:sigma-54-dependent transcriptional regulator [Aliikangiella coralliicola]|uniref:Sigma-54-dependent Fis family transcriptional regulator n=1 Tax=Aliikangiella coralliicola TaxID=2592383 RepID=A0A545UJN2_9GAMM|nr:sigma-54 dependent transcriptional regulator [Aliikangiella coralliicola]TQV89670.1 sigma-54-dependent Fis family transcriptional regulator [Aliikangiella coralliicola]